MTDRFAKPSTEKIHLDERRFSLIAELSNRTALGKRVKMFQNRSLEVHR